MYGIFTYIYPSKTTIHVGKYNLNSIRMGLKKRCEFCPSSCVFKKTSSWTSLFFWGGNRSPPPFRSPSAKWPFKSFHRYSVFAASPPYLAASSPPPRPHVRRRCEHKSRSCQKNRPKHQWETSGNLIGSRIFFPICNCIIRQMWAQVDYTVDGGRNFRRTHQLRLVRLSHDFVVCQKNWETTWDMSKNPPNWRGMRWHFCARV